MAETITMTGTRRTVLPGGTKIASHCIYISRRFLETVSREGGEYDDSARQKNNRLQWGMFGEDHSKPVDWERRDWNSYLQASGIVVFPSLSTNSFQKEPSRCGSQDLLDISFRFYCGPSSNGRWSTPQLIQHETDFKGSNSAFDSLDSNNRSAPCQGKCKTAR